MTPKQELEKINDRLMEFESRLPEEEARMLRNARYEIENIRLSKAIDELVNVAYRHFGGVGSTDYTILREKDLREKRRAA